MTTDTTPEPAGLTVLYEANDLLQVLQSHSEASEQPLSSAAWTLTNEIKRRLGDAIGDLDGTAADRARRRISLRQVGDADLERAIVGVCTALDHEANGSYSATDKESEAIGAGLSTALTILSNLKA